MGIDSSLYTTRLKYWYDEVSTYIPGLTSPFSNPMKSFAEVLSRSVAYEQCCSLPTKKFAPLISTQVPAGSMRTVKLLFSCSAMQFLHHKGF